MTPALGRVLGLRLHRDRAGARRGVRQRRQRPAGDGLGSRRRDRGPHGDGRLAARHRAAVAGREPGDHRGRHRRGAARRGVAARRIPRPAAAHRTGALRAVGGSRLAGVGAGRRADGGGHGVCRACCRLCARRAPIRPVRSRTAPRRASGGAVAPGSAADSLSAQAAVSLVLVALAALLGRSVSASTWFDLGFDPAAAGRGHREHERARPRSDAVLRLSRRHDAPGAGVARRARGVGGVGRAARRQRRAARHRHRRLHAARRRRRIRRRQQRRVAGLLRGDGHSAAARPDVRRGRWPSRRADRGGRERDDGARAIGPTATPSAARSASTTARRPRSSAW